VDVPSVLIFVAIAAVVIAVAIWSHKIAEKRRLAIAAWAASRGLAFTRNRDHAFGGRYAFGGLNEGDNRYAHNISRGRIDGQEVCAFDYHYQTYSRNSKGHRTTHHHHFSAVIVETPLPLKPLSIREENFFDKVGEFVGFDDIDFELAEFSRAFHVKSEDRRWAFDVLHQESMEFLLSSPRFMLEFRDRHVMTRRRSVFKPEEFEQAFQVSTGLLAKLPGSVLQELRGSREI
jgi:hypothetical protein